MLFSLEAYKVLITGGSGSIGRAIAKYFSKQGADIAISGTKLDSLQNVAEEIKETTGKEVLILPCDLSNPNDTNELIKRAEDQLGNIDVLINNAGINKDMLFAKMTDQDLYDVLDINLRAAFILTKNAISSMAQRRFGRIINISSVVGFTGNIGQVNYCASKAGIVGMSKAIALEYARKGVTVNCVAPGAISSSMIDKLPEQAKERFITKIPMCRLGEPAEIASACCFLASKEASYITGQTIHVNGGMLMV
ncbi:MAG: 3-oxoacyl-[acyl-carrier-protein] reductase [Holosporales bacterium]|jgi:3-oxoacyl-[acyl-carrier protein] reductase|nr:3-oxoacyl-[acyl-carrier-protein] reductase [Holosporales bacterium]